MGKIISDGGGGGEIISDGRKNDISMLLCSPEKIAFALKTFAYFAKLSQSFTKLNRNHFALVTCTTTPI